MKRTEMYAQFAIALLGTTSGPVPMQDIANEALELVNGYLPFPRKSSAVRDLKGRFASRTAQDAAEDEEIHAMAQALPEERHSAVDPYAPLRSFDGENGWEP